MTPPENANRPTSKTGPDAEKTSVITNPTVDGVDGAAAVDAEASNETVDRGGVGETRATPQADANNHMETKVGRQVPVGVDKAAAAEPVDKAAAGRPSVGAQPTVDPDEVVPLTAAVSSSAPPPWQRVSADAQYTEQLATQRLTAEQVAQVPGVQADRGRYGGHGAAGQAVEDGVVQPPPPSGFVGEPYQDTGSEATTAFRPVQPTRPGLMGMEFGAGGAAGRTTVNLTGGASRPTAGAAPSALRRPGRGPRRASLQIKRVDPWSVLKLALVLSVALFFVWLVAVGVLYGVLNGMGVWEKLNGTYTDLVQGGNTSDPLISAGRVFGVAAIIGAVNIVLFTALATVAAFVYNVSADLAGGLEVTLSERD